MSFFNEYALLFAVALPVVVIIGMQAFLFVAGERGTGLLPGMGEYPSIELNKVVEVAPRTPMVSGEATVSTAVAPSNDEAERVAA